eukprot:4374905-Amphidinium_carterae.1
MRAVKATARKRTSRTKQYAFLGLYGCGCSIKHDTKCVVIAGWLAAGIMHICFACVQDMPINMQ